MGSKSICSAILEDISREDLKCAADYYDLLKSGNKADLAHRICQHVRSDVDVLVSKDGPFTVSFWNELLDEYDIAPCRSYQDVAVFLTALYGVTVQPATSRRGGWQQRYSAREQAEA